MTTCPSAAWDRLARTEDGSIDACPECGHPLPEDGGPLYPFCSAACGEAHVAAQREADAALARDLAEEERIARAAGFSRRGRCR